MKDVDRLKVFQALADIRDGRLLLEKARRETAMIEGDFKHAWAHLDRVIHRVQAVSERIRKASLKETDDASPKETRRG